MRTDIQKKASVRLLENMLRIYSPSGKEEKLAAFFDRPKPRRYSEQLMKYITQFQLNRQRTTSKPPKGEPDD